LVKFHIFYITPMPGSDCQLPGDEVDTVTPSHFMQTSLPTWLVVKSGKGEHCH